MSDARDFLVVDSAGVPLTGAAGSMTAIARTIAGGVRTAPTIVELALGEYRVVPTDADETAGTVVLVDTGAGNSPRHVVIECFLADRSNQFWGLCVENPDLSLWAGAAPTVGAYRSGAGARTPPTLVAVAGAYLFVAVPTAADVTADTAIRIDGPAGSAQPYWYDDTKPVIVSIWAAPSPGLLKDPAYDVVQFLNTKAAGGVTLAYATNLFIGQIRSIDRTPAPAVFALNTGGPSPEPYFGGHRSALFTPTVQVMVRGPAEDHQVGEQIARDVLRWLHMQVVAGYLSWDVRESAPNFLGVDTDMYGQWSLNVECRYRSALS